MKKSLQESFGNFPGWVILQNSFRLDWIKHVVKASNEEALKSGITYVDTANVAS